MKSFDDFNIRESVDFHAVLSDWKYLHDISTGGKYLQEIISFKEDLSLLLLSDLVCDIVLIIISTLRIMQNSQQDPFPFAESRSLLARRGNLSRLPMSRHRSTHRKQKFDEKLHSIFFLYRPLFIIKSTESCYCGNKSTG